ncbi:MAG: Rieske 2Fe-2S domain-containing protein [Pseudomonadota bacterium]
MGTGRRAALMRLCRFDELADGAARGFDPRGAGEDTVFVLKRGAILRAYRNLCPHQLRPLEYRRHQFLTRDGGHIVCHAHNALFDPDSGVCVLGACLGQALQAVWVEVMEGWVVLRE